MYDKLRLIQQITEVPQSVWHICICNINECPFCNIDCVLPQELEYVYVLVYYCKIHEGKIYQIHYIRQAQELMAFPIGLFFQLIL